MDTPRDQAMTLFNRFLDTARSIRAGGDEVVPVGFLLVRSGDGFGVIQLPMGAFPDKDAASSAMRAVARKVGASYAIHISEGWTVGITGTPSAEEFTAAAAWTAAGNRLEDFPGAVEVLMASIDGPDIGQMTVIPIGKDGSLGEAQVFGLASGRFANLSGRMGEN